MPAQFPSTLEQLLAELGSAAAVGEVPLAGGDNLKRALALLEELHGVRDLARITDHVTRLAKQLDDALLGGVGGLAGEFGVRRLRLSGLDPGGSLRQDAAVPANDGTRRQLQLAPPGDVGEVAEGADHRDAGALLGVRQCVSDDGHLDAEEWCGNGRPEEWLIALVIGVGDQCDTCGDQLGAGCLDVDGFAAIDAREADAVVGTGALAILEFGLCHGSAEGDVPQRGRLRLVGLATGEIAQERALRHGAGVVINGLVGLRPVDREPEASPELLEDDLVLDGQLLAEFDEVTAGDGDLLLGVGLRRRLEGGVVGERGVTSDTEVVLHATLGRQTVVVPAHGIEDGVAAHALVAGDAVGVRIGEDVAYVEGPAHRGRGSIDRVDLGPGSGAIEEIGAVGIPCLHPALLDAVDAGLVGEAGAHGRSS